MSESPNDSLELFLQLVSSLVEKGSLPVLPEQFQENEQVRELYEKLVLLRSVLTDFATGNLSTSIRMKGFMAGSLKALQSHLRHITWQVQQVEHGDFSQRVHFLGDFSEAFNNMVIQLDNTMNSLKLKEEALTSLAKTLQKEVELRTAAVYALKQSEAKFKYLAEHDALTGTLNRRSFHTLAVAEMQSASLAKMPCCVALLDIDLFKVFNDTYGHLEGDSALKHMVAVTQTLLRQSDILGRYGGEEFILFFGGAGLQQGYAVAERIRSTLAQTPLALSDGRKVRITVSIGVAMGLPEWYSAVHSNALFQYLTSCADAALYKAKSFSRNVVFTAPVVKPFFPDVEPE